MVGVQDETERSLRDSPSWQDSWKRVVDLLSGIQTRRMKRYESYVQKLRMLDEVRGKDKVHGGDKVTGDLRSGFPGFFQVERLGRNDALGTSPSCLHRPT